MAEQHYQVPGPAYDAHEAHEEHYSNPAWWALSGLVMLGSLVLCLAFVWRSVPATVLGLLILAGAPVAQRVLSSMGYGVTHHE